MIRSALLIALAIIATTASGQIYKWRDADGKIQYSDSPPPAGAKDSQAVSSKPRASSAPAANPTSVSQQEAAFRKRAAERDEARAKQEKSEQDDKQRASQCAQARSQLAALESGQRISRFDDKGERSFLDDAERPAAMADARKAVDSWCNPPQR